MNPRRCGARVHFCSIIIKIVSRTGEGGTRAADSVSLAYHRGFTLKIRFSFVMIAL